MIEAGAENSTRDTYIAARRPRGPQPDIGLELVRTKYVYYTNNFACIYITDSCLLNTYYPNPLPGLSWHFSL